MRPDLIWTHPNGLSTGREPQTAAGNMISANTVGPPILSRAPQCIGRLWNFLTLSDLPQLPPIIIAFKLPASRSQWRGGCHGRGGRRQPRRPLPEPTRRAECNFPQSFYQFPFLGVFSEQSVPQSDKLLSITFSLSLAALRYTGA
jgi:hypothetical protein